MESLIKFLKPKLNLPIMIGVLLAIICIDMFVVPILVSYKVVAAASYRTPVHFNYGEVKALIDLVNQDMSPKVIMVGDSIIEGGGVGSGKDTIANFLQQDIDATNQKHYHVYNLGISGAYPADIYFVVKALKLTKQDIVVYDLNIGHYGSPKPLTFPTITAELSSKYDHGKPLYKMLKINKDQIEDQFQLFVDNHWKLYAYRTLLKEVVLNNAPSENDVRLNPWYTYDWTEASKSSVKRGGFNLNANADLSLKFNNMMIQDVRSTGARMFVFTIPLNQQMMNQYNMMDRPRYDKNVKAISNLFIQEGATYRDYEKLIPSNYFTDSLHPLSKGNKILADQLQKDLSSIM